MENNVNSLKEAIELNLKKYDYDINNTDIIKKLITSALEGNYKVFTRTPINTREYVTNLGKSGILKEIINVTKSNTTNIDEIINLYINKCFKKKNTDEIIKIIEQNSDLEKITKKIRFINTTSDNDTDFINKLWSFFSKSFIGEDNFISDEELKYDMLQAALNRANVVRDNVRVLKTIDPMSKDMTEMDAVTLVEEYVYNDNIPQLIEYINSNQILSGLLLQNLFDYTYFKGETKRKIHFELDYILSNIDNTSLKAHVLYQIMTTGIKGYNISPEEAKIEVIKNTLALNIYTNNKKSIDYDEAKLYTGNTEINNIDQVNKRIIANNKLTIMLLENGINTTLDDLAGIINSLSDMQLDFLSNIFVTSRSLSENKNKIDNSIYYGTKEQTHIYNLLNDPVLIDKLTNNQAKKVA